MMALLVTFNALRGTIENLGLADQIDPLVFFRALEQRIGHNNPVDASPPPIPSAAKQFKSSPEEIGTADDFIRRANAKSFAESIVRPTNFSQEEIAFRRRQLDFKSSPKEIGAADDFVTRANAKSFAESIVRPSNLSQGEIAILRRRLEQTRKDMKMRGFRG